MKELTPEQLQQNYDKLIQLVNDTFDGDKKDNLLKMYEYFKDRIMFAPASGKEQYHNAFPGGYIEHILHVGNITYIPRALVSIKCDIIRKHSTHISNITYIPK